MTLPENNVSKAVSVAEIIKRFPQLYTDSVGPLDRTIDNITSPLGANPNSLLFLSNPRVMADGLKTNAPVVVVGKKQKEAVAASLGDRTALISPNVELAMALTISEFFQRTPYTSSGLQGIHSTAIISTTATLGSDCRVGPNAYIGANVRIGHGVYIGVGTVIEDNTVIGDNTVIHPQVYIGHTTTIGARCEIHPNTTIGKEGYGYSHDEKGNHYKIPHQGVVILEDDVHIGSACAIDRATFHETRVGRGTKLDNHCHIAHNTLIGRNGLITAGFIIAGSSTIGDNFIVGGNAAVAGHIQICDNVQVAAVSVVSKGITQPGRYGGSPLEPLQKFLKTKASIRQVVSMRKQIKKISEHLGLSMESETEIEG